jgi:putative DNA primase/helicase
MVDAFRTLHHQQAIFSKWTGTHYREYATEEMRSEIYRFLEQARTVETNKERARTDPTKPFKPSSRTVGDVLDAMRAACQIGGTLRAPAWLITNPHQDHPKEIISCKNGLLHLPTGQMIDHTPNFYSNSALEYDFDPAAPPPKEWLKFLASIWPEDIDARATLQEIFGYLLGTDTDQQKIPLIVGPKRSGKGTIARILTALVGPDAVVSPTLAGLESNFGVAPLIGKSIALIADARLSGRADQQRIAERLLSISGEDTQTIDRKHVDAWTGRLSARFFIMTNELPRISDASGALASRFLILTMTRSFLGAEDHGLTDRLLGELPGILNWAIEGWRTLRARGYFMPPASSAEAVRELEDLGSPIGAFIREKCTVAPGKTISCDALYAAWEDWCKDQGRDHSGIKQTFGRDLRAYVPGITTTNIRTGDGRTRMYEGICLTPITIAKDATDDRFKL